MNSWALEMLRLLSLLFPDLTSLPGLDGGSILSASNRARPPFGIESIELLGTEIQIQARARGVEARQKLVLRNASLNRRACLRNEAVELRPEGLQFCFVDGRSLCRSDRVKSSASTLHPEPRTIAQCCRR